MHRSVRKAKALMGFTNLERIKKHATLFVAELNGEIISGHGYLQDKDNVRSWVIGSKRFEGSKEYVTMVANASKLIIWEAIKYAKEKGIKEFDMGGYYTGKVKDEQKERVNIFKQSFGGKLTTHYIYQKDYSKFYKLARRAYQLKQNLYKNKG